MGSVTDCVFAANNAKVGGHVLVTPGSEVRISGSSFRDGSATDKGGALAVSDAWVAVDRCSFDEHSAALYGGTVVAYLGARVSIARSAINNASASFGGGLYASSAAQVGPSASCLARCVC